MDYQVEEREREKRTPEQALIQGEGHKGDSYKEPDTVCGERYRWWTHRGNGNKDWRWGRVKVVK